MPAGALACPHCGADERTGWNEETYLVPADKHVRRDIRVGEKIRNGVPLTTDSDERFVIANRGAVVQRDKVRRVTFEQADGKEKKRLIPEKYVARIRKGQTLEQGEKIEDDDVIPSRASGLLKVKEYKDKRVVTIQRIEKRRLFPGYVFGRLGLEDEQMMELIDGIKGAVRSRRPADAPPPPAITVDEILNKEPGAPKEAQELRQELDKAVK